MTEIRLISNPPNPFMREQCELEIPAEPVTLEVYEETSTRSIITQNNSPDVGFDFTVNPYRGCQHGCVYCFARPYHEYLGWGAGTDFQSKITVKKNAPQLLRKELSAPGWKGDTLAFSFTSDPYIPLEASFGITRQLLEICLEFRNPVMIITKSVLIKRDLDLLLELKRLAHISVIVSLPFLNREVAKAMEPFTPPPASRLRVISELAAAGIPVGLSMAPLIPGLNDHEIPLILKAASEAGAGWAFMSMLRLPGSVAPYFVAELRKSLPTHADKVLNRIKAERDGKLNNAEFGTRMRGKTERWQVCAKLFQLCLDKYGLARHAPKPDASVPTFRRNGKQLDLFAQ